MSKLLLLLTLLVLQDQRPAIERDPASLPRAEAGRWEGLFQGRSIVGEKLPRELAPLVARAQGTYGSGRFPQALELYFEILERAPDFPPSLLELGATYFRLRRYGDAITCLERFVEVAPGQVFRTQALAHSYYSLGRYEEARVHYELVLAGVPDSVEAVRGLALTSYRIGDVEAALSGLQRVLELDPEHGEALVWRAQILHEEGETMEALAFAERARDADPYLPRAWFLLSQILFELGRDEEAEAALTEWTELDRLVQEVRTIEGKLLHTPTDFSLLMRLVGVQREIGDSLATRDALARALRNRPQEVSEVELRIFALDTLFDMGDERGAALAARELAATCQESAEAWKRLEVYFARMGDAENQVRAGEVYLRLKAHDE